MGDPDRAPALTSTGVYRNNETLLLMHLLAYHVLHAGRSVMVQATGQGWSLRRFRERLLRAAARVARKARRLTFIVAWRDRKSTRLNSSHVAISYAVLCVRKKR